MRDGGGGGGMDDLLYELYILHCVFLFQPLCSEVLNTEEVRTLLMAKGDVVTMQLFPDRNQKLRTKNIDERTKSPTWYTLTLSSVFRMSKITLSESVFSIYKHQI